MPGSKIYTRTGDNGTSSLITGKRTKKSDTVFEVLGTLDELNACIGTLSLSKIKILKKTCFDLQNDIFLMGSLIAGKDIEPKYVAFFEKRVTELESEIDAYDSKCPQLRNFILPGGCVESIQLHLSRAITRRAERTLVRFLSDSQKQEFTPLEKYINRVSDLLFVMARYANVKKKVKDTIWRSQ